MKTFLSRLACLFGVTLVLAPLYNFFQSPSVLALSPNHSPEKIKTILAVSAMLEQLAYTTGQEYEPNFPEFRRLCVEEGLTGSYSERRQALKKLAEQLRKEMPAELPDALTVAPRQLPPTALGTPWINIEDTRTMTQKFVTSTADSGPGSLRGVIAEAQQEGGNCWIKFQLAKTDPNFDATTGTWRITLRSSLVVTGNRIFIDGLSQAEFGGESNPKGPEIVIDGRGFFSDFLNIDGRSVLAVMTFLVYSGNQNWIRGFCVFPNQPQQRQLYMSGLGCTGSAIPGPPPPAVGNRLSDNFIAVNPDGETIPAGLAHGLNLREGSQNNLVENNIFAGSGFGISISSIPNNGLAATGNVIRNNGFGTNQLKTKRISTIPGTSGLTNIPFTPITFSWDPCQSNVFEGNIIAGTSSGGIGQIYRFNDEAASHNIIRNNRIGVGPNGENIAPPAPSGAILDPNLTSANDQGAYGVGIFANVGDVVTGNIIGNMGLAGIQVRYTTAGNDRAEIRDNQIFNTMIGIEAGQTPGANLVNNRISNCRSAGIVVTDELLDASNLYGGAIRPNPIGLDTRNVTVSQNTFTNVTGPHIGLSKNPKDFIFGGYQPNNATVLQAVGPNLYQPTPALTGALRNPDGSITVSGQTVGAGVLELYSNGNFLTGTNVASGNFTATIPADKATGITTVTAAVTVNNQTSEFAAPLTVTNGSGGDTIPPTVTVTAPVAGQQIESKVGTQVQIAWQSSDNVGVVRHDVWLARPGPGAVDSIASGLAGTAQTFTWNVPENLEVPQAQIVVMAFDAAGNQGQGVSGMFTVKKPNTPPPDTEKPVVSNVTLSAKKVKRKLDPTLVITWKSTDNIGVVNHDLVFAETTPVVSGLSGAMQSFTWTVPASIPKKTVGTVKVTARDAAGNFGSGESSSVTIK